MKKRAAFDSFRAPPTLQRRPCKITPSTDRLPISTVHCLKMKMGAVKLLRRWCHAADGVGIEDGVSGIGVLGPLRFVADTPFIRVSAWSHQLVVAHSKYWAAVSSKCSISSWLRSSLNFRTTLSCSKPIGRQRSVEALSRVGNRACRKTSGARDPPSTQARPLRFIFKQVISLGGLAFVYLPLHF